MKNKLIGILLILIMLIVVMPSDVFADYDGIDTGIEIGDTGAIDSSVDITERIVGTLQVGGTVISIIALIIIGMRYMFSSIEEKAQMKGVIGYYIAGCVLVFATSNVLSFAYNVIDDVKHSWESRRVEPTCTARGYVYTWCTDDDCDESNISWIEPLGHSYGNWTTKTAATCTKAKVLKHSCTRCGYTETKNSGNALGHSYGNWTTKTAATCTSARVDKRICTKCNDEDTRNSGSALGHSYTKKDTSTTYRKSAATCSSKAVYYYRCSKCTAKGTSTYTSGSTTSHSYTKKDTSATYRKSAATCTSAAVYYYRCTGCTRKGSSTYTYGSTASHSYTKRDTSATYRKSAATCTSAAVYYYRCSKCTAKGTGTYTSGSSLGHSYSSEEVWRYIGFFDKGYKYTCSRCSYSYTNWDT